MIFQYSIQVFIYQKGENGLENPTDHQKSNNIYMHMFSTISIEKSIKNQQFTLKMLETNYT